MLTLQGTVVNIFLTPGGKDKATGADYGNVHKVQIQGLNDLRNGETRVELVTLTTSKPHLFHALKGKEVRIPVGSFVAGTAIQYFLKESAEPEVVS
jgi:hypothetical protein